MLGVFRGLIDRMKAIVISTVALDFEAQFVAGQAERKADRPPHAFRELFRELRELLASGTGDPASA